MVDNYYLGHNILSSMRGRGEKQISQLYRIFHYDCPPMAPSIYHPFTKRNVDFILRTHNEPAPFGVHGSPVFYPCPRLKESHLRVLSGSSPCSFLFRQTKKHAFADVFLFGGGHGTRTRIFVYTNICSRWLQCTIFNGHGGFHLIRFI